MPATSPERANVKYYLMVDDDDRHTCPDKPFTAGLYLERDGEPVAVGVGRTDIEAIAEAVNEFKTLGRQIVA